LITKWNLYLSSRSKQVVNLIFSKYKTVFKRGSTMKLLQGVLFMLVYISLLSACATNMPSGPSVLVLPGAGKSFDQFRAEDFNCRHYAFTQIGGATPSQAVVAGGTNSAKTDIALGVTEPVSGLEGQSRFDMSYIQCMYSLGHRVPVSGNLIDENMLHDENPPFNVPTPPPPR
jgi:hypothetical protein